MKELNIVISKWESFACWYICVLLWRVLDCVADWGCPHCSVERGEKGMKVKAEGVMFVSQGELLSKQVDVGFLGIWTLLSIHFCLALTLCLLPWDTRVNKQMKSPWPSLGERKWIDKQTFIYEYMWLYKGKAVLGREGAQEGVRIQFDICAWSHLLEKVTLE